MSWEETAKSIDGRVVVSEGVEMRLEVVRDSFGRFTATVRGNPTPRGMKSFAYTMKRREYRDDWSAEWTGELPDAIITQLNRIRIREAMEQKRELYEARRASR